MVTSAQFRAARGLLNWTVRDLAERAGVHRNTVTRAETDETGPGHATAAIVAALEAAGVEFIPEIEGGEGVRMKLSAVERKAIRCLRVETEGGDYLSKGDLHGVSLATLDGLVSKGLAEIGSPARFPGDRGWRLTKAGWAIANGSPTP